MTTQWKQLGIICTLLFLALAQGCARHCSDPGGQKQTVTTNKASSGPLEHTMAPAFHLQDTQHTYNRIGRVFASGTQKANVITIDPDRPVLYVATRQFSTAQNTYTNLIYRVHFLEQPYSLIPFNFGAGQHVGLLVILTLNQHNQVVLVTTAQTCGCYAVSIPTKTLPTAAYPKNWPAPLLRVAGERLPASLPALDPQDVLQVVVRPVVHRIMDIKVVPKASLATPVVHATTADLASLKQLPLEDGTATSLYYQNWPLTGHVKGAIKPWETLLLGLVSFDFFVGMDKEYGDTGESGNAFYTSLKFWNRQVSDMNDFASYLQFNGWRL